jgi:hypothetical protein
MVGGCRLVTFINGCVRPGLRCSATTPQVRISGLSAALLFKALEKALHEHICDQTGAPSSQRDGRNSGIAGAAKAAARRAADGLRFAPRSSAW